MAKKESAPKVVKAAPKAAAKAAPKAKAVAAPKAAVKAASKAAPKVSAAGKSMTKGDIVDHLSTKHSTTKKLATDFLESLVELSQKQAKKGFTIPGLGKLSVSKRKARNGRNPQTGAAIKIPAKNVVKFKIAKQCQDAVYPPKEK